MRRRNPAMAAVKEQIPAHQRVRAVTRLLVYHGGHYGRVIEPGDEPAITDPIVRSNPQAFRWPERRITPDDFEEVN
jgi:hypothetical protein